ncbi:ATP-binding protein [Nocardioides sp.]|uniref:sensor histidine kinase n=1 Tax=Nocardioides sp. TaxID=35761 RepID=UPI002BD7EEA7|nr:ATP-binding protein [Nocardioides sp.]HXH80159.1 ATP-binding protein [Nocardioides sp.]
MGDATHLERVVFNLLSNALKFTEDGGRVSCTLGIHDETAVLEVADNGIGIPVTEQAQLFTKFFRASTAQKREIPGTGIGLAVVAAIIERHAGTIEIASEEGQGTSVKVCLPLA